jgi:hypothetical protein
MEAQLYYNPENPASYGGVQPLLRALRAKKKTSRHDVEEWLRTQETYTLHKPARKRFPRNRYVVYGPNELWQADLNDMRGLSEHNDGVNYLLAVIDVFSKRLHVKPLKRKSGAEVVLAFDEIFGGGKNVPKCLQTDKGTEFTGALVKRLFKKYNIRYVTTQNPDVKAAVVERVNRTLKTRMWRYLTHNNTYRYIDVLDKLVNAYNRSPHRSLGSGLRPIDVTTGKTKTVFRVWRHMYGANGHKRPAKFKAGDTVRIAKEKGAFAKGYETNWSKEVFVVDRQMFGSDALPYPLYILRDLNDRPLEGRFYEHELQRVILGPDHLHKIEKILDTKGRGRSKRHYVKWVGYGDDFNSWIPASELKVL